MSSEPPPFQEASRCDVCKCSFSTFKRRHHCRCCGRTLCADHSSNQMALPQYGLHSCVRVCSDCFDNNSSSPNHGGPVSLSGVNVVTDAFSNLDIVEVTNTKPEAIAEQFPELGISECKCGMPLCICEAPAPPRDSVTVPGKAIANHNVQSNPKTKKAGTVAQRRVSQSSVMNGIFFHPGHATHSTSGKSFMDYKVNGEGLREAIKNGDITAVKKLLSEGVDANYCDKQGSSLLHLAAVFNLTEITFALMEYGASLECKNSQGETPLDCAPAMLQHKMKKKIEQGDLPCHHHIIQG